MFPRLFSKFQYRGNRFQQRRNSSLIRVNEEILQAIFEGKAVVALESAIITHGMQYPGNLRTALAVQRTIREQGAVPATIAVLKGQVKVGLTEQELEELSQNRKNCWKISRRDYPYVISRKLTGGTTVSGTMLIAHKVGIPIFVTGGIGGVHREGEKTMDISADLIELSKTPVAVISSGVKSILDIEKTLEFLETQGVAVATYGQSKEFPAFYCKGSGFDSPCNLASDFEAAQFIQTMFDMQLGSGMLIGVPIPEIHSLNEKDIEIAIEEGLREAKESNVKGKDVTPFLLSSISDITEGKSLEANVALVLNNAFVGGRIAVELAELRRKPSPDGVSSPRVRSDSKNIDRVTRQGLGQTVGKSVDEVMGRKGGGHFDAVVVGGTNMDFVVGIKDEGLRVSGTKINRCPSRAVS